MLVKKPVNGWRNMTTPNEERQALKDAYDFLHKVFGVKRVPKELKEIALLILKHYPAEWRIDELYEKSKIKFI